MNVTDLKKGMAIVYKGEPHTVVIAEFVFPGKGQAFVKTKLKNLKTGNLQEKVFKSHEMVDEADVARTNVQFIYKDEDNFYFMDQKTYDQQGVPVESIGNREKFIKEEINFKGLYLDGILFDIELPPKMVFTITTAPPGVKGDTANNANKKVTIETGATIDVPLFINEGDKVRIKTDTGDYVERVTE